MLYCATGCRSVCRLSKKYRQYSNFTKIHTIKKSTPKCHVSCTIEALVATDTIIYFTMAKIISTHWVGAGLRWAGFDRWCTFSRFFFLLGDVQGSKEVRQQAQDVDDSQFIRGVWLQRHEWKKITVYLSKLIVNNVNQMNYISSRYLLSVVCVDRIKRGNLKEQVNIACCSGTSKIINYWFLRKLSNKLLITSPKADKEREQPSSRFNGCCSCHNNSHVISGESKLCAPAPHTKVQYQQG